jgi:TetR/AcrR family acrAB operon transcriptional repressor
MDDVAARLGLSKGAAYWHFKNKNDLLINLIEEICAKTGKNLSLTDPAPEKLEDLRVFFKKKLSMAAESELTQKINKLFHRRHEWPEEVLEQVMTMVREMHHTEWKMVSKIISAAQQDHEIRADLPADELSILLSAVFHGLLILQVHEFYRIDFVNYADFIFDAIEKALKNDG